MSVVEQEQSMIEPFPVCDAPKRKHIGRNKSELRMRIEASADGRWHCIECLGSPTESLIDARRAEQTIRRAAEALDMVPTCRNDRGEHGVIVRFRITPKPKY